MLMINRGDFILHINDKKVTLYYKLIINRGNIILHVDDK